MIDVKIAIMSHLSDAQEIGSLIVQSTTIDDKARMKHEQDLHINFAKRLLMKYEDNINQGINENELDEIWKDICG